MRRAQQRPSPAAGRQAVPRRYAAGHLFRLQAIHALGLTDYGALLRSLRGASVPRPELPRRELRRMAEEFVRIVVAAGEEEQ